MFNAGVGKRLPDHWNVSIRIALRAEFN